MVEAETMQGDIEKDAEVLQVKKPRKTRSDKRFTKKEEMFLKEIAKGKSQTEAARKAYNTNNPGAMGSLVMTRLEEKWGDVLDKYLPDRRVAMVIADALKAKKRWYSKAKGEMIEEKDHYARLKAADIALKIKNKYPKEEVDHNVEFTVTLGEPKTEHPTIYVEKPDEVGTIVEPTEEPPTE